jgi:anti-anti-sigma factor
MGERCSTRAELRLDDGVPVIALIGEFDIANRDQVERQLHRARHAANRRVVLDLSQTRFLDCTTLGVLARAHVDGLDITVRGATGIARKALEISGLAEALNAE